MKKSRGTRMRSPRRWLGFGDTARGVYEGPATRHQRFLSLMTGQMQQLSSQMTMFVCWVPRMSCPSSGASTHHRRHSLLLFAPASAASALRPQPRPERTRPSIHASPLRTIDLSHAETQTNNHLSTPTRLFTTFLASILRPPPVTEGC